MLALCNAESLQRLTAEEVPAVLKQSPSTRAVRRSRTPTVPITRGPEAPRYFSGCPVSPLLASDWTEKGGLGSPQHLLVTFVRTKVTRGPGPGRPRRGEPRSGPGRSGSHAPKRLPSDAAQSENKKERFRGPILCQAPRRRAGRQNPPVGGSRQTIKETTAAVSGGTQDTKEKPP